MKTEDIAVAALGIAATYSDSVPTTRYIMYKRISARQRELFVLVGGMDPEFYGVTEVLPMAAGKVDLGALEEDAVIYPVERLQHVRISDPGASGYTALERVNIVPTGDEEAYLAPRATYRSGVIAGWAGELDDVVSLSVAYARRPRTIDKKDDDIEFLEPFADLLTWDLVRDLIRRTAGIEGEKKASVYKLVEAQEKELIESLASHVGASASVRQDRFGS